MDDRELGVRLRRIICTASPGGDQDEKLGAAARELLAKPVATREEVEAYLTKRDGYVPSMERVASHLAALSHFAPPARLRMMADGMEVDDIAAWMKARMKEAGHFGALTFLDAARMAHRLATTPAPEVDPDAEAKRLAWAHKCASFPAASDDDRTSDDWWPTLSERDKAGWRAVAAMKEKGGE